MSDKELVHELDDVSSDLRSVALRNVRRRRECGAHLVTYISVSAFLTTIWLIVGFTSGAWFPWPIFPIGGWGIGVAAHAWSTFGPPSRPIVEADIEHELARLSGR